LEDIPSIFNEISEVLAAEFENLGTCDGWKKLYSHLLSKTQWLFPEQGFSPGLDDPTILVPRTILLLQSLSPIRISVLDGQTRTVSVAHYIRNVIPTVDDGNISYQSALVKEGTNIKEYPWNPAVVGHSMAAHIVIVKTPKSSPYLSQEDANELWKFSKMRVLSIQQVKKLELYDAVDLHLKAYSPFSDSVSKLDSWIIRNQESIGMVLTSNVPDYITILQGRLKRNRKGKFTTAEAVVKDLVTKRATNTALPRLHDGSLKNCLNQELLVLCRVLGIMTTEASCGETLKVCMDRDWKAKPNEKKPFGREPLLTEYEPTTYLGHKQEWFEKNAYAVSKLVLV
jgi:hypothetical protein